MKRHVSLAGLALASVIVVGCTKAQGPGAANADKLTIAQTDAGLAPEPEITPVLYENGFGPLKIGMTREQVIALAGEPTEPPDAPSGAEACEQFSPTQFPSLVVMLEEGRLTRVGIEGESIFATDSGLKIGSSEADIAAKYVDRAIVSPHKYDETAKYHDVWATGTTDTPDARGIRFVTDGSGKIVAILAGGPSIQYVEGCL